MTLQLRVLGDGCGLAADVSLLVDAVPQPQRVARSTGADGRVTFRGIAADRMLRMLVAPQGSFWWVASLGAPAGASVECVPCDDRDNAVWRRRIGLEASWSAAGVRIGVIDTAFGDRHPWQRVGPADGQPVGDRPHGRLVAAVLKSPCPDRIADACADVDVLVHAAGVVDPERVDIAEATDALVRLVDEGVHIISMSFGLLESADGDTALAGFENALEYAESQGVLLIAAAGNDGADGPAYPARSPRVLAIGATLVPAELPANSYILVDALCDQFPAALSRPARITEPCFWPHGNLPGPDGLALPGVGVVTALDCDRIQAQVGTSFAAPLAAALAAARSAMAGEPPTRDHLRSICRVHRCRLSSRLMNIPSLSVHPGTSS